MVRVAVACLLSVVVYLHYGKSDPTVVYWTQPGRGTATAYYKSNSDGEDQELVSLSTSQRSTPSSLTNYPGGRQLLSLIPTAKFIPGSKEPICDLALTSEHETSKPILITQFRGPEYITAAHPFRWSNDSQDTFVSFQANNANTNKSTLYRYSEAVSELLVRDFEPLISGDERLEVITHLDSQTEFCSWNRTGDKVLLATRKANGIVLSVLDCKSDEIEIINDPNDSGIDLADPVFSQTKNEIYGIAADRFGNRGVGSLHLDSGQFIWLLKESPWLSQFTPPIPSPNGDEIALGMRLRGNGSRNTALGRVSVNGGLISTIVSTPASGSNELAIAGWCWQ